MSFAIDYRLTAPLMLDVQFELAGFTVLLGRSGAGKTSLLKALAGLLPATGSPWGGWPAARRRTGYLPQNSALFPHLTVLENAAFALRGPKRLTRAQALLDDLGVGHLAGRSGGMVSGGEAQRVALARALARAPELLLLDEPSAGLDAGTRDEVLARLIETVNARGIPALAATHDPAVAGLADQVVILVDGRIVQQGRPGEVYANPKTVAAAKLLGYQNFFSRDGRDCAIRAEDIEIAETGIEAVVTAVRPHGAGLRLTCGDYTVHMNNADTTRFSIGQPVRLNLPAAKVKHLSASIFPADTVPP